MRYENPLYMAEDAGAADLIAGGRLQLGISRGSRRRRASPGLAPEKLDVRSLRVRPERGC
jgi:alkanesulfonate monooxygenase SsuD/methylene tetrahydromethanopterin reductase-like flavin-dependent oxidoreductase (luciferase family)